MAPASERGDDIEELVALGERVKSVTRRMGMSLTSFTPPAKGSPLFDLGPDEVEMGVGIHYEPDRRRDELKSADELIVYCTSLDRVGASVNLGKLDEELKGAALGSRRDRGEDLLITRYWPADADWGTLCDAVRPVASRSRPPSERGAGRTAGC